MACVNITYIRFAYKACVNISLAYILEYILALSGFIKTIFEYIFTLSGFIKTILEYILTLSGFI